LVEIPIDAIHPNPLQPRKSFDQESLNALAKSIASRGTLQPVLVRPTAGGFELVAGERRWRAARLAGLRSIPAIARQVAESERLELALIENLHRENLNPVERAQAYLEIKTRLNLGNEALADRVSEDRATVANYIRILDLPEEVLDMLADGRLSMGHGRALLGIADPRLRLRVAQQAASGGWSVRQTEATVREASAGKPARNAPAKRAAVSDVERQLTAAIGTRVVIREGRKRNTGRITLEYYSLDDFERITAKLGLDPEAV